MGMVDDPLEKHKGLRIPYSQPFCHIRWSGLKTRLIQYFTDHPTTCHVLFVMKAAGLDVVTNATILQPQDSLPRADHIYEIPGT